MDPGERRRRGRGRGRRLTLYPDLKMALIDIDPSGRERLDGLVAGHIREAADWSYSPPLHQGGSIYHVVATARLDIELNLPLTARLFSLTVPFNLRIDTDTWDVQGTADLGNAALSAS